MKAWKAAAAALAIVLGAGQAQAVRWVEYRVEATGTVTEAIFDPDRGFVPTSYNATMAATVIFDLDATTGYQGTVEGINAIINLRQDGSIRFYSFDSRPAPNFDIDATGPFLFRKAIGGAAGYPDSAVAEGTSSSYQVRDVAGPASGFLSYQVLDRPPASVPEPDGWTVLIAGFALLGSSLRSRRNPVARLPA